jgi:RNA polymerase sigma-70 factor (ECF subfamily)
MGVRDAQIEKLYEELGPVLLAYARSIVLDLETAEDALHHVFLKLMASGDLPKEPRPYLFRAVRNTCFNVRRSAARQSGRPCDPPAFTAPPGLLDLLPELEAALRELPEEQREVVVLHVWGEMTIAEAARILDLPVNTAASRYRYAVLKLRQLFHVHLEPRR